MSLNFKLGLEIDNQSKDRIVNWTMDNYKNMDYFTVNGFGRRYCSVNKFDTEITELVNQLAVEKYSELGIIGTYVEPIFGHFIGVNTQGGNVHPHMDKNVNGLIHTRINFMLSMPEMGGQPIVKFNDQEHQLEIEEGDSWLNIAGLWEHTSTIVNGNKPRIVLSLGALVPLMTLQIFFPEFFPDLKWETRPETNKMITIGQ